MRKKKSVAPARRGRPEKPLRKKGAGRKKSAKPWKKAARKHDDFVIVSEKIVRHGQKRGLPEGFVTGAKAAAAFADDHQDEILAEDPDLDRLNDDELARLLGLGRNATEACENANTGDYSNAPPPTAASPAIETPRRPGLDANDD